jgi:phage shock protein C
MLAASAAPGGGGRHPSPAKCLQSHGFASLARLLLNSLHRRSTEDFPMPDAAAAAPASASAPRPNLVLRNDTLLGVCEAIGQDFGFHGNWLRLAFAILLFWFPLEAVGTYLALGLVVLMSRLIYPDVRPAAAAAAAPAEAAAELDREPVQQELPLAA